MSLHINENKLLEKYKTIWTMIKDLNNIKLDGSPVLMIDIQKLKQKLVAIKIIAIFMV